VISRQFVNAVRQYEPALADDGREGGNDGGRSTERHREILEGPLSVTRTGTRGAGQNAETDHDDRRDGHSMVCDVHRDQCPTYACGKDQPACEIDEQRHGVIRVINMRRVEHVLCQAGGGRPTKGYRIANAKRTGGERGPRSKGRWAWRRVASIARADRMFSFIQRNTDPALRSCTPPENFSSGFSRINFQRR
jgi:hypothetical protein